jgi:hypothetical protein
LSVRLPACLPVLYLPAYLSAYVPACLAACLSACLPACLFVGLSACLREIINDCRISNPAHLLLLQIHKCEIAELQLQTNIF